MTEPEKKYVAGDGARSIRSSKLFRVINFELYSKPNTLVMSLGIGCFAATLGYIWYMRSKYESQGYYPALQEDGTEVYTKKKSKWD